MPGDRLRAGAQGDPFFKIGGGIDLVGNFPAVAVEFVFAGPPTGSIPLRNDAMHTVRS